MKYRLINKQTKEEHICSLIKVQGFDYYTCDDINKQPDEEYHTIEENPRRVVKLTKHVSGYSGKPILVTNNPILDVPRIIVESSDLACQYFNVSYRGLIADNKQTLEQGLEPFISGYNKSQETHPFTPQDMIEYANWLRSEDTAQNAEQYFNHTDKDMLQVWRDNHQIKTIYYNAK